MRVLYDGKALIVGVEKVDLREFPDLKVIGCNMTGTDHLPLQECEERGIRIISLKGETEFLRTVTSTAEHTMGLILALFRNYKRALKPPYEDRESYKGHTLAGKTLGIIGYGRVGRQVARLAKAVRMKVSKHQPPRWIDREAAACWRDPFDYPLDQFLVNADVVSLHIPLEDNEGFFTEDMFKRMKRTAYLVNTSRDRVIQDGALLWALDNKVIAGAAVDFTDNPLLVAYAERHDNLILTPHIGGCTVEDMEKTEAFITQKVKDYVENKN